MVRFITILVIAASIVVAEAQDYSFERITSEQGLSQNNVLGILQDHEGYMWFCTYDGLNRYDGYEFKVYRTTEEESSISSNLVKQIIEDHYNNLWIATFSDGICKFDKETEKFTRYRNSDENPDLIADNSVSYITCDSRNNIWFGSNTGLSCARQITEDSVTIFTMRNIAGDDSSLFNNNVNKIFEDKKGRIWICTHTSLDLMIRGNNGEYQNKFYHFLPEEKYWNISDMAELPQGYVILHFYGALLVKLDELNYDKSQLVPLPDHASHFLLLDGMDKFWTGGYNGLYLFERTPNGEYPYSIVKHIGQGEDEYSLSNEFIRSLYYDDAGILWLGTNGGGILKYNAHRTRFRHYKHSKKNGAISHNKIWKFYEDGDRNLWIGTEGGGVNLLPYNDKRNYEEGFSSFDVAPVEEQNFVFDILDVSDENRQRLYLGSGYNTLIAELFKEGNGWKSKPVIQDIVYQVMALCEDEYGTIWLGTYKGGLGKYLKKGNKRELIVYRMDNSSLHTNIIRSFLEDSKGRLWIGTNEGLMLLTKEQKKNDSLSYTLFVTAPHDSSGINNNYVVPMLESSMGEIWVGTFGSGINIYKEGTNLNNGTFTSITEDDGLANNTIKSIIEDDSGVFWVTSNKGLSRIDPGTRNIRNFTTKDGLQDMEFTDLAGYKRQDGEILIGGVNGFNAFYPQEILRDTNKPKLVLNELEVMNKPVKINEAYDGNIILAKALNRTDTIILSHRQNSFKIYFAALQFTAPGGNRFKYKLNGFDEDWINAPVESRFATYTNIEAGLYTFLLQGSNSDGVWTKIPKELTIWIKPPFWLMLWFRVSFITALILVISVLLWLRFYSINVRNKQLEAEVKKQTEKLTNNIELLNDTNAQLEERQQLVEEQSEELRSQKEVLEETNATKDKFYSILAHDLKGPFNTLLGYLDLLHLKIDSYDLSKIKEKLDQARESSQLLYNLVENLLQWSRSQRGLIPFTPEDTFIDKETREVMKVVEMAANAKGVNLSYRVADENLVACIDVNMYKTILRNLLSNAIKYAKRNDNVEVNISKQRRTLMVAVSDTGVGIPEEAIPLLFRIESKHTTLGTKDERGTGLGLVLCKEFIDIHGGEIAIESTEGIGTTVSFSLPLQQSMPGKSNIDGTIPGNTYS